MIFFRIFFVKSVLLLLIRGTSFAQVSMGYCEVVFHRPLLPFGIKNTTPVVIKNGQEVVLQIYQNSQHTVWLPASELLLNSTLLRKGVLNLRLEKGKKYLIEVGISGVLFDKPKFKLIRVISD
jgi:hypothetical protein